MNDKRGMKIGIATVMIAIALLATVPSVSAYFIDVVGTIQYEENGTKCPYGWDVWMENLNESYPEEPWHDNSHSFIFWDYKVSGEATTDECYVKVNVTSPDGKWFDENISKLADVYDTESMNYIIDLVVTEVIIPEEEYSKYLPSGWNLISLPLEPSDSSTSAVLGNDTIAYDAVQRYNATSHSWEDVMGGTMESGVGYFVHVTTAGTCTYSGTAYTSMNIDLQPGLNMIGSLNCTKPISDALSSIDGNYTYVASWNATEQSYETYNPVAPEPDTNKFNDFFDMERGTGYFVSMKTADTLTGGC